MDKIKTLLPSVLLFVLVAGITHAHIRASVDRDRREILENLHHEHRHQAAEIEKELDNLLEAAQLMAAWIRLGDREAPPLESMAEAVVKTYRGVERVALAPGGVITLIYPQPWAPQGIGKNLFSDQSRAVAIRQSFRSGRGFLTGPHEAGGQRFFSAQVPVSMGGLPGGDFWGLALASSSLEGLCRRSGLDDLAGRGYVYRLERKGLVPGEGLVIAGMKTPVENGVGGVVAVAGLELTLSLGRELPLPALSSFRDAYAVGLIVAASLSMLLFVLARQPARLQAQVKRQTAKLTRVNRRFAEEIRRRRHIAKVLEASVELSRGMFENTPAVKLLVNALDMTVVEVNSAAVRFFGWTREEFAGMSLTRFNLLSREELGPRLMAAMRGEKEFFTARYRLAGGEERDVEIFCAPVRRHGILLLQYVIQDVTGRETARRELRASQSRLESVFNAVECGLAELDAQGTILFVNRAFTEMFGRSGDEARGLSFPDFMHPGDRAACLESHAAIMDGSIDHCCLLIRFPRPGKEMFWGSVCKGKIKDSGGGTAVCVAVVTDVTALMAAKKAAEEASKSKTRFLANISHEIRSPMNAIMGLTELTLRSQLEPQQRGNLEKSLEAGRALVKVIEAILDYASLDSGRIELVQNVFDPADVVEAVRTRFEEKARTKGLALRVDMAESLPRGIQGDQMRLDQILSNLVGNAVKFTKAGEVRLRVGVDPGGAAAREARLVFTVSDTGKGMDSKEIEALFQPFAQAESEMSKLAGGPGLGLSIARKLTDLMGGRLTATSVKRSGSTFRLEVSFALAEAPRSSLDTLDSDLAELTADMAGMRVLVVDDNALGRHTAMEMLRLVGIVPTGAQSGTEALSQLSKEKFEAVLLDIQMPGMDGFETMQAMRALMEGKLPPVIAVSGHARHEDRLRCVEAGMAGHVAKPYSPEALFTALRQHAVWEAGAPREPAGLDSDRALRLLMGNRELYGRLLSGFVREYAASAVEMRALVQAEDKEAAAALAHSIKGLAANLGGEKLKLASLDLELGLRQSGSPATLLSDFNACLEEFIALATEAGARFSSPQ